MSKRLYIWDPIVRLFHWSLALAFVLNAFITDPEADLHHWLGYSVAALIALRLVWGFIGTSHARFSDFRPSLSASLNQLAEMSGGLKNRHAGHSPLGALMIYNLLLTLAAICATGYMMTTLSFFGVEWVEEAHEMLVNWAEISVLLHVAAVVFESRRLSINLFKSMITGYKNLPE